MVEAYPLYWPEGVKRTESWRRKTSKFSTGFARSRDFILAELKRLGASSIVLSTNIALRRDGLPSANEREPQDPGAAVYFLYKKHQMCFACDQYRKVMENLTAIGKTIEALRGIERWGSSDMVERAFSGFKALPADTGRPWTEVLGTTKHATRQHIEDQYRMLAKRCHPDLPTGSHEAMAELNAARDRAIAEVDR
jgi:hypothetical protein